jgi:hypothetical protein
MTQGMSNFSTPLRLSYSTIAWYFHLPSFFIPEVLSVLLTGPIFPYARQKKILSMTPYESIIKEMFLDLTINFLY